MPKDEVEIIIGGPPPKEKKVPKIFSYFKLPSFFQKYSPIAFAIEKPKTTLLIITIITLLIGSIAFNIVIRADLQAYLPQNDKNVKVLEQLNEDGWSTDSIIIYVKMKDEWYNKGYNITNVSVLKEISAIEEELDYNKNDSGKIDGVAYLLSISVLVKELNSTPPKVVKAIAEHYKIGIDPSLYIPGDYAIPEDQDRVNLIVDEANETGQLSSLVYKDKEAVIIIGISGNIVQEEILKKVESLIKDKEYTKMEKTGMVAVSAAVRDRTQNELKRVLPFTIIAICLAMFIFHRTFKVVIICLLPVLYSLIITFGILGSFIPKMLGIVITPQVIIVGPILLTLGISYGLYITNRYVEGREGNLKERMSFSVKAIHAAIMLSAITTAVGFFSLMFGTIPPIVIIGFALTIGILTCYILTMIMVPALVLVMKYRKKQEIAIWSRFSHFPIKNYTTILAVIIIISLISISQIPNVKKEFDYLAMSPQDEPTVLMMREYSDKFSGGMPGFVRVESKFEDSYSNYRGDNIKITGWQEPNELKKLDGLAGKVKTIKLPNGKLITVLCITDIMKAIKLPDNVSEGMILEIIKAIDPTNLTDYLKQFFPSINASLQNPIDLSLWDVISANTKTPFDMLLETEIGTNFRRDLVDIFYNSISEELRYVLVSKNYKVTLLYLNLPSMNLENTRNIVVGVNSKIIEGKGDLEKSELVGQASLIVAISDLIVSSQIQSLAITILLCTTVIAIMWRRIFLAIITMIPSILVISWEPAIFVGMNLTLNIVTVMIASIGIGTGVDYSIQISQRIRLKGASLESTRRAVEGAGISFVEATTTMLFGYSTILLINIVSYREFILMLMLLLGFNAIAALLALPALYTIIFRVKGIR